MKGNNNALTGTASLRRIFRVIAVITLAALCAVSFIGARKMFRGVPLGSVLDVDRRTGTISVDLGLQDGVLKGMKFSVVDGKGRQVAMAEPAEVYDDMFWSKPLSQKESAGARPGMQVRWVFTAELAHFLQARRTNTPKSYREFAGAYPESVFLSQLVRLLPEEMLREIDPEFFDAWKLYTPQGFEDYLKNSPQGGFAAAAASELKSLREYEAQKESERLEREKRAAAYEEEAKRQEEVRQKVLERQRQRDLEEMHGKLVNNSTEPVKFVFASPSIMPETVVKPGESFEINHPSGTYSYKVFAVSDGAFPDAFGTEPLEPEPLAEGTVDIEFDFWEVTYP